MLNTLSLLADLHGVNLSAVALFRADGIPALVQVQLEVLIILL